MTVPSAKNKITSVGNGITREWPYDFVLPETNMLRVYITPPDGLPELITTGYTVDRTTSKVTYPSNPDTPALATGAKITLLREVPYVQETAFGNQERFLSEIHEKALDNQEYQIQQIAEKVNRAVVVPVDDQYTPDELATQVIDTHKRYSEIVAANAESVAAKDAAKIA